jgi:predicted transcriptional regulator
MSNTLVISFVGTTEQKAWLEQWAKEEDRSVSYVMRQILNSEAQRRQAQPQTQKPVPQQTH